jgi:AcrR family transcriptional regulator
MPRHSNPDLEARILKAARKLWHRGGEEALSMREVAREAGTNTPAVYRRFTTREDILRALVLSYQQEILSEISQCEDLPQTCQCLLDFTIRNPREYELMMSGLLARVTKERPNVQFMLRRCAEWLGGTPRDHEGLVFSLYCLLHGIAMLRISGTLMPQDFPRARVAYTKSVNILIENAAQLAIPSK